MGGKRSVHLGGGLEEGGKRLGRARAVGRGSGGRDIGRNEARAGEKTKTCARKHWLVHSRLSEEGTHA
jgi:hypothetical protein